MLVDEPLAFGGLSSGPNPFDLLGAALGACTLITMRLYAERKGWPLGLFSVRVTHRKDSPTARDRFERVISLADASPEQREKLAQIAERCPVHLLVERGADITTTLVEQELREGADQGLHARLVEALCDEAA
jgi:putative redox protein